MEKDDEVSDEGNQYDYGFRIYNPRLGKFLSVDPLFQSYPFYTPYQFAGNTPIWAYDLDGLEEAFATDFYDEKQGKYIRRITLNPDRTAADVGTIQFKYSDGSESKIVKNTTYLYYVNKLKESLTDDKPKSTMTSINIDLTGPTSDEKPVVKVVNKTKVEDKTKETANTANKKPAAESETSSEIHVTYPNSPPPLPGGFILGSNSIVEKKDWKEYNEKAKNIAEWLIANPDFNIVITTDEGIPNGEKPTDDITWTDFKDFTYRDRTNAFTKKWVADIVAAGKGEISPNRIKTVIDKPNSFKVKAKFEKIKK
jgi:RHS repeat-associated protein